MLNNFSNDAIISILFRHGCLNIRQFLTECSMNDEMFSSLYTFIMFISIGSSNPKLISLVKSIVPKLFYLCSIKHKILSVSFKITFRYNLHVLLRGMLETYFQRAPFKISA